jgi:hypothetical protein
MTGKTIRIFLADGVPTGTLVAEVGNWTGKVIVVPRAQLGDLAKRPELKRPGVYLLAGPDPESPSRELVYVGESEDVLRRLKDEHVFDQSKDFWSRTAIVVSKDDNLTKVHVKYLESRLMELVLAAGRARLHNGKASGLPALPEADRADVETFLEHIQLVLPILGFAFTQPKPVVGVGKAEAAAVVSGEGIGTVVSEGASPVFFMKKRSGAQARAQLVNEGFVVFKGSLARKDGVPSWMFYKELRAELVEAGKLIDSFENPDLLMFTEDVVFSSPSAAAAVVIGGDASGLTEWLEEGTKRSFKDWQAEQLAGS